MKYYQKYEPTINKWTKIHAESGLIVGGSETKYEGIPETKPKVIKKRKGFWDKFFGD